MDTFAKSTSVYENNRVIKMPSSSPHYNSMAPAVVEPMSSPESSVQTPSTSMSNKTLPPLPQDDIVGNRSRSSSNISVYVKSPNIRYFNDCIESVIEYSTVQVKRTLLEGHGHYSSTSSSTSSIASYQTSATAAPGPQPSIIYSSEPVVDRYKIRTYKNVEKTGVMIVGIGGNNGTTLLAGILCNKHNISWNTKWGLQKPNWYGSLCMSSTTHLGTIARRSNMSIPNENYGDGYGRRNNNNNNRNRNGFINDATKPSSSDKYTDDESSDSDIEYDDNHRRVNSDNGSVTRINGEEVYVPLNKLVPMLDPINDIEIGGWDISNKTMLESMSRSQVLDYNLQMNLKPYLEAYDVRGDTASDINNNKNTNNNINNHNINNNHNYDNNKCNGRDFLHSRPLPGVYIPDYVALNQSERANNVLSSTMSKYEMLLKLIYDINTFKKNKNVKKVIVLWSATTEKHVDEVKGVNDTAANLMNCIYNNHPIIAPSTLYAVAAILSGSSYINGGPQNTLVRGVVDLANICEVFVGGDDFKSGQTKLKSVLVDFLISAGIKPMSIVSYNHLGNNDGYNLSSPSQFKSKELTKSNVVDDMVGSNRILYDENERPDHCVVIKYVPYVGDSKRAMDEYTSQIFLGGHNTLVVHNTCEDSLLAAPLMLDLLMLTELSQRIYISKLKMNEAPWPEEMDDRECAHTQGLVTEHDSMNIAFDEIINRISSKHMEKMKKRRRRRELNRVPSRMNSVLSILGYLCKAPLVPENTPIVNALFSQRQSIVNLLRSCISLPPENHMLLEHKVTKKYA